MEKKKEARFTSEDRLSDLADELIHHILSFSDVQLAVQTSLLSKRWKLIWTTLPFLNFTSSRYHFFASGNNFISNFLSNRNHHSDILKLNLAYQLPSPNVVDMFLGYAILCNVQELNFDIPGYALDDVQLSAFTSTSIKKLKLSLLFGEFSETDIWDLPALTTLHLTSTILEPHYRLILPESYLTCLPSLRTLVLDGLQLPEYVSLPALTTLYLTTCTFPPKVWDFPALSTLTLDGVWLHDHKFFSALANLRNLILFIRTRIKTDYLITCPQLASLEINASISATTSHSGKFIVLAPKIRNFSSVGFFPITFGVSELENVNIKLRDSTGNEIMALPKELKRYYTQVIYMFPGLSSARILTLDLETIEALSAVSSFLVRFPSPFYNLKYVKVPLGCKEISISTNLKRYLLGRSPKATIVTTLPQDKLIPQMLPVCLSSQRLLPGKPLATPVAEAGNDRASSSRASDEIGLWKGHEVNSEFLSLLDCIDEKYPETFDYFTTNSKKLCTMKLNMLCTIVKDFTRTSMTEVDIEMIAEYRAQFADLQRSFNVKWLVNHMNFIEQLQFSRTLLDKLDAVDSRIDNAKSNLQDLHALRMRMLTEIHMDIGTMDTSLDIGYIGDDLFSGP